MVAQESTILSVIHSLDRDNILPHLSGNCVLAADVIQNMLGEYKIQSRVVECQLMISKTNPDGTKALHMIGYEIGIPVAGQVDTHAVTITQSDRPLLVDVSVGHFLNNSRQAVVVELTKDPLEPDIIARAQVGEFELTYRKKKNIRLPALHQKDLVTRVQQEYQLLKNIKLLKMLVAVALVVSSLNAARGIWDHYNKYISEDVLHGVSVNREIIEKLDIITEKLNSK
jgi:hypothetical protein